MQYLDNDMDELFNKAGNDYPLKTDAPDFDAVLGKLNPVIATRPGYGKYLLLLLLLPVGYLLNNKLIQTSVNPPMIKPLPEASAQPFSKGAEKNDEMIVPLRRAMSSAGKSVSTGTFEGVQQWKNAKAALSDNSLSVRNGRFTGIRVDHTYPTPIISFPNLPVDSNSSHPIKKQKAKSSIYIGVVAGPDLSTIKYQSIKNIGFSAGILAGYKFSKKWSVETGLIFNNKKYYTDGKYFDKTKSGISPNVYVESLNGSCNMFEVPISVRYDFSTSRNRFFATLGASSYFMKKEKYTYDAFASGNYYEGHRSYNNSGNHFFSNMQFSVGYNRQLSDKINLRVEPYIKIPVRDIGIGNMPITSSGIYFSVMQSIK